MNSALSSGLLGGLIAAVIGVIMTSATKRKNTDGELKHGLFILLLAIACLGISLFSLSAFFFDNDVHLKTSEFFSILGLFFGFGIGAFACFAEYYKVRGKFDGYGIEFYTPWTGYKKEMWSDLVSVKFNSLMYWYTLSFESGNKIRISSYIPGHGQLLRELADHGHTV